MVVRETERERRDEKRWRGRERDEEITRGGKDMKRGREEKR